MHLSDHLNKYSDEASNAITVALATHKDKRIKNLASGYNEAEIGNIAIHAPAALLLIAGIVIDTAFKALTNSESDAEIVALARDLRQTIADKEQLDVFLALLPYSGGVKHAH